MSTYYFVGMDWYSLVVNFRLEWTEPPLWGIPQQEKGLPHVVLEIQNDRMSEWMGC